MDTIAVLEGLQAPLLAGSSDSRSTSIGHQRSKSGHGDSESGISLNDSAREDDRRRVAAEMSATSLAQRMAHVSHDLHRLLQDSSVNLIAPDVRRLAAAHDAAPCAFDVGACATTGAGDQPSTRQRRVWDRVACTLAPHTCSGQSTCASANAASRALVPDSHADLPNRRRCSTAS